MLIPPDYKNLDEEEQWYIRLLEEAFEDVPTSIPPAERLVRVLLENDSEVFGCTDRAFYLVFKDRRAYYARSTLLSLILSEHSNRSSIIKHVVNTLRNTSNREKAFIALALISESTSEYFFKAYGDSESLAPALVKHGQQVDAIVEVECRELDISNDELGVLRHMYSTLCDSLELLGARCAFGVVERDICIRVGDFGFILKKAVLPVLE